MIESKTGEAEPNFICDECTFETSTETNLKKHKAKEHKTRLEKHNEALEEEKIKDVETSTRLKNCSGNVKKICVMKMRNTRFLVMTKTESDE